MTDATAPVTVTGITDAVEIDAGSRHTCARHASGRVSCWGYNGNGELGSGSTSMLRSAVPVAVADLVDATGVAAGVEYSCAIRATGALVCWGRGHGSRPAAFPLSEVRALDIGWSHACAITLRGPYCWGQEYNGELGDGPPASSMTTSSPVAVLAPP